MNALNAILHWASKGKAQVIFVVNDPVIIQAPYLENAPKRKPDIILVKLDTFKRWYGLGNGCETFDYCRKMAACHQELSASVPRTWSDVIQFWELKAEKVEPVAVDLLKEYTDEGMTKSTTSPSVSGQYYSYYGIHTDKQTGQTFSPAAASSELRTDPATSSTLGMTGQSSAAATLGSGTAKGSSAGVKRKQSEPDALGGNKRSRTNRPNIPPAVQCAYYAIERFRSSWKVSHVSGIYIKGDSPGSYEKLFLIPPYP